MPTRPFQKNHRHERPSDESGFKGSGAYETCTLMSGCRRQHLRVPCWGFPCTQSRRMAFHCTRAGNHLIEPFAFTPPSGKYTPPFSNWHPSRLYLLCIVAGNIILIPLAGQQTRPMLFMRQDRSIEVSNNLRLEGKRRLNDHCSCSHFQYRSAATLLSAADLMNRRISGPFWLASSKTAWVPLLSAAPQHAPREVS